MSEKITAFLADERNAAAIDHVLARGVRPTEQEPVDTSEEPEETGTAVFTGTLPVSRTVAQDAWRAVGGRVTGSVSGNTDFVVAGEGAGSKLETAEELGVPVLDWEAFADRVRDRGGEVPEAEE
jgi:DNA ligase (NAD+)